MCSHQYGLASVRMLVSAYFFKQGVDRLWITLSTNVTIWNVMSDGESDNFWLAWTRNVSILGVFMKIATHLGWHRDCYLLDITHSARH